MSPKKSQSPSVLSPAPHHHSICVSGLQVPLLPLGVPGFSLQSRWLITGSKGASSLPILGASAAQL